MSHTPAACDLRGVAQAVWDRCRRDGFTGADPYDGLKSSRLAPMLTRSRWMRLAVIQGVKRSPVDLRPLLGVPAGQNPKGLALLMQGMAQLPSLADGNDRELLANTIAGLASLPDGSALFTPREGRPGRADDLVTLGPAELGWGYDFPWQNRAFLQPAFYPTVVCTSFVVDAFAESVHPASATVTQTAAGFVANRLHRHEDDTGVCYSYSPCDRTRVFNASLYAGKILARAGADAQRREAASVVDYVVHRQRDDGAWIYGEADHWQWIDNLHTGFILETITGIATMLGEPSRWNDAIERGLHFYRNHFFGPDLTPYYYADRPLPLDSHTVAQSALTLLALADRDPDFAPAARRILEIGIDRLWNPQRSGFAFQRGRLITNHTVFMRWSQAWMLRALATCVAHEEARP